MYTFFCFAVMYVCTLRSLRQRNIQTSTIANVIILQTYVILLIVQNDFRQHISSFRIDGKRYVVWREIRDFCVDAFIGVLGMHPTY